MKQLFLTAALLAVTVLWAKTPLAPSPRKQWTFAVRLYRQKDFFRAVSELKRFSYLYPESSRQPLSLFIQGKAYYFSKRRPSARESFTELLTHNRFADAGAVFLGQMALEDEQYQKALSFFDGVDRGSPLRYESAYRKIWTYIYTHRFQTAKKMLRAYHQRFPDSPYAEYRDLLQQRLDSLLDYTPRSEWLAAFLALIPGLGHLYAGSAGNALSSLLSVGINAGLTYLFGFYLEDPVYRPASWIFGGLTAFLYGANIYGAFLQAHKTNQQFINGRIDTMRLPVLSLSFGDPS